MTPQRILILGGSGFLGSHVRGAFGRLGHTAAITVVSARAPDDASATAIDADRTEDWQTVDLADAGHAELAALIGRTAPDVIVNCAGATTGDARRLVDANIVLVAALLAIVGDGASPPRFVQLGSSAEYGVVPIGVPIRESVEPAPVGTYGMSKLAATELVLAAGRSGAIDAVVLRVFNPLGAGLPMTNLLTRAASQMARDRGSPDRVIHLGSLEASRDFVDVADVADVVVAAALTTGSLGPRIFNIGSGRATQARALITTLADIAGFRGTVVEDAAGSSRSADVPWQCADIEAATSTFAWRPQRAIEDSVRAVWEATIAASEARSD